MLFFIYITVAAGQVAGCEYMEKDVSFAGFKAYCSGNVFHRVLKQRMFELRPHLHLQQGVSGQRGAFQVVTFGGRKESFKKC